MLPSSVSCLAHNTGNKKWRQLTLQQQLLLHQPLQLIHAHREVTLRCAKLAQVQPMGASDFGVAKLTTARKHVCAGTS